MYTGDNHVAPPPPVQTLQRRRELPLAARELLAGFAAGAANVTSGYPFDTVKVRLQSAAPGRYDGAVHCLRTIVRHEGIRRGLFRGLSSPLVGGTAETGVNYLVYSRVLDALRPAAGGAGSSINGSTSSGRSGTASALDDPAAATMAAPLPSVAAAGAVAGAALSFILGPTELVKCRMQQAGSAVRYPGGPLQCVRLIVATEGGPLGLARGLGATLAREVPGNALFFVVYEALRRGLLGVRRTTALQEESSYGAAEAAAAPSPPAQHVPGSADSSRPRHQWQDQQQMKDGSGDGPTRRHWLKEAAIAVFCGGTAGTVMWAVVLPVDVAKTRLQTARPGSELDVGLRRHWAMLWREGGLASLYAGLTPTLVRAFPANACQWLAWELVMRNLGGDGDH